MSLSFLGWARAWGPLASVSYSARTTSNITTLHFFDFVSLNSPSPTHSSTYQRAIIGPQIFIARAISFLNIRVKSLYIMYTCISFPSFRTFSSNAGSFVSVVYHGHKRNSFLEVSLTSGLLHGPWCTQFQQIPKGAWPDFHLPRVPDPVSSQGSSPSFLM